MIIENMKLRLTLSLLIVFTCCGCSQNNKSNQAGKQTIYTTIQPLKQIVESIVGDDFDIEVLVPAGASPETFEPTPKQFIALNESKLVFSVGLIDFERNLISKINGQNKLIDLSHGIDLIEGSCSHNHHGHECHSGIDPHVWSSPKCLKTMAHNAFTAINDAYPDSLKYRTNYERLNARIDSLDTAVSRLCKNTHNRYFIVYHPAMTYFARDYGIEQVSIEHEGKEPSAKRLADIIEQARRDGVKRIFYQVQFPRSSVEIIAKDMGAEAVEIDPLSENVIENIGNIAKLITE